MEGVDDDFGDIYAEVEVQASTAINGFPNRTQSYTEQYDINTKCSESDVNKDDSIGDDSNQFGDETNEISSVEANGEEQEEIVDNGSDSEDDLNIVLNDDANGVAYPIGRSANLRSGGFDDEEEEEGCDFAAAEGNGSGKNRKWVDQSQMGDGLEQCSNGTGGGERGNLVKGGYRSQYKYLRYQTAAYPCNSKANGSMGSASYSSTLARGNWDNNGSSQHMGSSSVLTQSGYNFSLPWYRTILDINIAMFEQRPWRHPGTDITDYFNFGFDEESWKSYCNCLEQFRQQTSIQTRNLFHEPSEPNEKASEVGSKHETVVPEAVTENIAQTGQGRTVSPSPRIAFRKMKQLQMPKGRAIQVKDSIAERQPSFGVRRPLDLDSDVVIQIAVQDSMKDSTDSEEELGHINSSVHKASENGDLCVDDNRDFHSFGSPSSDDLPRSHAAVPKVCSQQTTASDPVSMDSDDHGSGHISDVNRHHHQKVTICSSEEDAEAKETSNNTRERFGKDICNESALAKQSQRCPSSSSGNHSETPLDRGYIDPGKVHNNLRKSSSNSVTELQKSITSDRYHIKDSKTHGVKMKSNDCILRSRNRSPIRNDLKNYNRKLHSMSELSELRSYTDDGDASPISNTGRLYNVDHSTVGRNRKKERLQGPDSYSRKHFSNSRESELSFDYSGERFSNNEVRTSYKRNPRRKGCQIFGDEIDRHLSGKLDEEEYFLEQKLPRVDEAMDGDWYHYGPGHNIDDMGPLTYRESRRMALKHSSYLDNEIGTRWRRRGDDLQHGNRMENNGFPDDWRFTDDFIQENFRRSISYNVTERDYLDDNYERHLHCTRREIKSSCRREGKYGVRSDDFNSLSIVDEDDYWRWPDHQSLSSNSHKDPDTINGGIWHDASSVKNDSNEYNLRKIKENGRVRRHIQTETCRDTDWPGSYIEVFDTEDNINLPDDQVHFERRRHYLHSEVLNWTQNSYISGHRDEKFRADEASFSTRRTSRPKRLNDARHGPDHAGKLIDDGHVEWHKSKILGEGHSGIHIDGTSNVIHRGNYEKTHPACRDSVDMHLFVGEGKSSGRRFTARSSTCNDKQKNMDPDIYTKQKTFKDSNESYTEAGENDDRKVAISQKDENWHDKYPVMQHNEALDIEEGQIITAELNENLVEKECATEAVAPIMDVKRTMDHENVPDENRVVGDYDNHRILAMRAKMEKRRERFKEPITLNKEMEKIPKPPADLVVETAETKQRRPVRKRRWGES
ncbi:FIP1[III]-like protein [Cornus florida]|uniref:FIP1[III]-like protein n=1 Tax=Cornus florida TaxID=4283 RepID=UPI00289F2201|nr:FIP1[III]-like protein [Cornus florida]